MSEPTPREAWPFPDESKDTNLQHSIRNLWHDNFNESEFIAECEHLVNAEVLAVLDRLERSIKRGGVRKSVIEYITDEKQRYGGKEQE